MDWGNDYFTFSDTNIEYIWRFLRLVHERGWLYLGHRSTEWCPRCGTSISAHELRRASTSGPRRPVALRALPAARPAAASRSSIWTTTPWTLPANVAAAVKPDAEYGRRETGEWVAVGSLSRRDLRRAASAARSSSAGATRARSTSSAPGAAVEHRVIPWDDVTLDDGTGIVHIAPGCGSRGLRALARPRPAGAHAGRRGRALLRRLRLAARALDGRGGRADHRLARGARPARRGRPARAPLPECWRCHTPLIFRISDDWFIGVEELRQPLLDANADGRVDARVHGQADGRLARQHGRLEHLAPPLLRAAAALLPVRVRAPERDRLEGGARGAGARRPRPARGAAPAVDRRGADRLRAVRRGGAPDPRGRRRLARRRHRPVLDARLAERPEYVPRGTRPAPRRG